MAGTFTARIAELRHIIGTPETISGSVTVDQRYAHVQHENLSYRHPRGGQAKYLETPLFRYFPKYLQDYANTVLVDGGRAAFRRSVEHLSDQVIVFAPVEFTHLRRSGHPVVTLGGRTIYDRAPEVHRLSEAELRALNRLRWPSLPGALKGYIYWNFTARGKAGLPPRGSGWRDAGG